MALAREVRGRAQHGGGLDDAEATQASGLGAEESKGWRSTCLCIRSVVCPQVCALKLSESQLQAALAAARHRGDAASKLAASLAASLRGAEEAVEQMAQQQVRFRRCLPCIGWMSLPMGFGPD